MRAVVMDPHVSPQDFSGHWLASSSDSKSNNINVFVHLCFAVFVYLCICVFVYLCICVILALSLKVRVKISIDWHICFSWFAYNVFVYLCICVFVYLCTCARWQEGLDCPKQVDLPAACPTTHRTLPVWRASLHLRANASKYKCSSQTNTNTQ